MRAPFVRQCTIAILGLVVGWSTAAVARKALDRLRALIWPLGPLHLKRPLVTLDIESTGLNTGRDRIVEIAALKLLPNGKIIQKGPQRLNPGVMMLPEVIAIHGISNEELANQPTFNDVALEWRQFLEGCDLHGYNVKKFDLPLLRSEFRRAGQYHFPPLGTCTIDSFRIFSTLEQRNLKSAVRFYCGEDMKGAHSALADSQASLNVLVAQLRRYKDLPRDAEQLSGWCSRSPRPQDLAWDGRLSWRENDIIMNFGRKQGQLLVEQAHFNRDYLLWMKGQDFSDETLAIIEMAIKGIPLPKPQEWEQMLATGSWREVLVESNQPVQQTGWDVTPMPPQEQEEQQQQGMANGTSGGL